MQGQGSEHPVLNPHKYFFLVSGVVNYKETLMMCSFVIREKESDIPLTSGDKSPWGRMNQPYKCSVCIPK